MRIARAFISSLSIVGTFLRTVAIDSIVREFITFHSDSSQSYQIISLGAGFDTRLFRFADEFENKLGCLSYFEIDFGQVIQEKKRIVDMKPNLKDLSASWRPISYDLNEEMTEKIFGDSFDSSYPTLVISECCFMYLTSKAGDKILSWCYETFKSTLKICSFDPVLADDLNSDPFAKAMLDNFEKRGLDTRSLLEYPSKKATIERFQKLFNTVNSYSMLQLELTESLVSEQQRRDVFTKAALDEYEEWYLMADHYFLVIAEKS